MLATNIDLMNLQNFPHERDANDTQMKLATRQTVVSKQ